jgi:hypothetical protein
MGAHKKSLMQQLFPSAEGMRHKLTGGTALVLPIKTLEPSLNVG